MLSEKGFRKTLLTELNKRELIDEHVSLDCNPKTCRGQQWRLLTDWINPFAIVGGNPAERIRYRFDEQTRASLAAIAWWNWDAEKITRNVKAICSSDLEALRSAR